MKKKWISALLTVTMVLCLAGCGQQGETGESKESDLKVDTSENTGDNKVNEDFSKNVNVNRASDFAKNEVELPIEGIGRGVSTSVKGDEKYKIVVMTRNSTNPYMVGMWAGGEQAGKDMELEVQTLAPATQDSIEEQVTIMESLIEQNVVAIGTAPETGAFMRTGVDYYETGYLVTKELCEVAGKKGKAIVLEGPAGVQNMEERKAGILAAIKEYPDIEVIASQTANCKRAEGMQVMENLLQGEKTADGLTVVASCNDEMAIGAIQALKAQNIEGVYVGGADASKDAASAVKDGDLYVTYNTDPYGSTYLAVAYLTKYLNDKTLPEEYFIPFPSERNNPLITSENVDEYMEKFKWYD